MNNYDNFKNLKSTILERMDKGLDDSKKGCAGRLVLIAFDHECRVVMDKLYAEINDVDRSSLHEWFLPRGTTALHDGVIKSAEWINRYEADNKIVVIVTDGLENASSVKNAQLRAKEAMQKATDSGVAVFLVGDQDCLEEQRTDLGILDPSRSIPLSLSGTSTLRRVVTSASRGQKAFFTRKEQQSALRRSSTFPTTSKYKKTILHPKTNA